MKLKLLLLLISVQVTLLNAQNDPCNCDEALRNGVFSYRLEQGDHFAYNQIIKQVTSSSYEEYQKGSSGVLGGMFKAFKMNAGFSREMFQKRQSALKTLYSNTSLIYDQHTLVEQFGDKNVLDAWSRCKIECSGLASSIVLDDEHNITLKLKWVPPHSGIRPIAQTITPGQGVQIVHSDLFKGKEIKIGESYIRMKRPNPYISSSINITISTGQNINHFIPKHIAPPPPPPSIAGTWRMDNKSESTFTQVGGRVEHFKEDPNFYYEATGYYVGNNTFQFVRVRRNKRTGCEVISVDRIVLKSPTEISQYNVYEGGCDLRDKHPESFTGVKK